MGFVGWRAGRNIFEIEKMMKRIVLLLFVLVSACALQAQDSIPLKKWQKKKIEVGLTASAFFPPPVYGEGIIDHKSKLSFGVDYFMNWHFSRHIGITWGFAALKYKQSFGQVIKPDNDTANYHSDFLFLKYPVTFLWDINPDSKVKCFINSGLALTVYSIGPHYDGGSLQWLPPSKMAESGFLLFYNLNAGIKIPVYKKLGFVAMLQYEDCFKSIIVVWPNYAIYTKPRFLSLHVGLCL